jgi:lipoic acid synthetase
MIMGGPGGPGMRHPGGPGMHGPMDPEKRSQHLRDVLQLRADQEGALKAFVAAMKPPERPAPPADGGLSIDRLAQAFAAMMGQVDAPQPPEASGVVQVDASPDLDEAADDQCRVSPLSILDAAPPDVMNHNLETVPRLYREARPGSDYAHSLALLQTFKQRHPGVPTKSGLMVGLGETDDEILAVMRDMREHSIDMLTIGQYLAPTGHHLPVRRYVHPDTFERFEREAKDLGFQHAAVGALVRSSYHADLQAHAAGVT